MATFNVSTAAQFQSALNSAKGGDKIVLAAGNYGSVYVQNHNYSSAVTITTSAANPAHFDGLFISNTKNLSLSGLDLGRSLTAGQAEWTQLNYVYNSSNIQFDNVTFHGSKDNDPTNDGVGLQLTGVAGFSMTNSHFSELYRGIAIQQSSNLTVKGNDFHTIRSDGMVVAAVDGITIDSNNFSDFRPIIPDHSDFIQFWNLGQTKGSSNITIKNNVMFQPQFSGVEGTGTQGIWISDPMEFGYKNVLIQNNLIYSNGAYNGLSVNGGDGVQILGNTVLSQSTDSKDFWIRMDGTTNVTVRDNIMDNMVLANMGTMTQSGNVNLSQTPTLRTLFAHLNDPASAADLITAASGYKAVATLPAPPVSHAIGSGLGSMLINATGSSLAKTALSDVLQDSSASAKNTLFAAAPVVQDTAASSLHASLGSAVAHAFGGGAHMFDHFTAMA